MPFRYFDVGSDFFQLTLNLTTGRLRLMVKLADVANQSFEVESLSTQIDRLNDGKWHSVRLDRDGLITRLTVDNAMWSIDLRQQPQKRKNRGRSQEVDDVCSFFCF
jgi:Laminin G domain